MSDERGLFARTWCRDEALLHGLNPMVVQCSISMNNKRVLFEGYTTKTNRSRRQIGTLRCGSNFTTCSLISGRHPQRIQDGFWCRIDHDNHKIAVVLCQKFAHKLSNTYR